MAPVFHTDDNAPGFIMSSVQSPCLLFCPAPSPPLLHTPWLLSFVSLSVTLLPVHCEENRPKPYPPRGMLGSVVRLSGLLIPFFFFFCGGWLCWSATLNWSVMHFTFQPQRKPEVNLCQMHHEYLTRYWIKMHNLILFVRFYGWILTKVNT